MAPSVDETVKEIGSQLEAAKLAEEANGKVAQSATKEAEAEGGSGSEDEGLEGQPGETSEAKKKRNKKSE